MEEGEACSIWHEFDQLQLCFTLSPQLKNYYKYGKWRSCGTEKARFMACINDKSLSKQDQIKSFSKRNIDNQIHKITNRSTKGVIWEVWFKNKFNLIFHL